MKDITVTFVDDTPKEELKASVLIEGLPGIGHVGKLVAEHMIKELDAKKIIEITSVYLPPQVIIDENGVARLCNNEIYRFENEKLSCLFLVGDFQSNSNEGHYLLSNTYVNIAKQLGVKRVYTLGGYGVGNFIEKPRILAAVNNEKLKQEAEDAGAIFGEDEPGGGIIGAAGLMLGISAPLGIEGFCLMGETSGYLVDPKSAATLLEVLNPMLGIEIDVTNLNERAEQMEQAVQKLAEQEKGKDEELSYIG